MRKSSLLLYIGNSKFIIICSSRVNKILGDKSFFFGSISAMATGIDLRARVAAL